MCNREGLGRVVFIPEFKIYGLIVGPMGAFYTTVRYVLGGIEFEVLMENDEFELMEDTLIEYDSD